MKKPPPNYREKQDLVRAKRLKREEREEIRKGRASQLGPISGTKDERVGDQHKWFSSHETERIVIPKVFSLIENPEESLRVIDKIRIAAAQKRIHHIYIDHQNCDELGLCASSVMDVLLLKARKRRLKGNKLYISGKLPRDQSVSVMLRASGIPHQLGLVESVLPEEQEELVKRCELTSGRASRVEKAKERNAAAMSLKHYFNDCLDSLGYRLTLEGANFLYKLLTEVIGNAEEHGGPWHTIGHWQRGEWGDQKKYGECHVVIFNFGTTIYESLVLQETSPRLKANLRRLSEMHEKSGWFGLGKRWNEETLWTLYALQERVTRYFDRPGMEDRGVGTINMIEFFNKLAKTGKMCILSGHSYILYDGTYTLGPLKRGSETLQVIAFNKSNSLEEPPDSKYVFSLPIEFPGTVVSIRLTLDKEYLQAQVESANGNSKN